MELIQVQETQCGIVQPLFSYAQNWKWFSIRKIYIYCLRVHGTSWFCTHQDVIRGSQSLLWSFRPRVLVFLTYPIPISDYPYIYFEVITGKSVPYKVNGTNPPLPKLRSINQVLFNELLLKTISSGIHEAASHSPLKWKNFWIKSLSLSQNTLSLLRFLGSLWIVPEICHGSRTSCLFAKLS